MGAGDRQPDGVRLRGDARLLAVALRHRLDGRRRAGSSRQSSEIRKFNYIGDTHIITGEVVGKRVEDGRCLVDIEMRGTNQRGTVTCPGTATVALPSREHGAVVLPAPPVEYAQQAATMLRRHGEIVRDEGRRELA